MTFGGPSQALSARLSNLESHLKAEHPALLEVVPTFRRLDKVLYKMGLLGHDESLAMRIPWWPLITILGTFSSGKSTFINHFLGVQLQATGNQAVDDKFTVICFGPEREFRVLPGMALDADPRFPFFGMSSEIEKVAPGEGKRIDAYLQLKTCSAIEVKGKILIDSPGFDADDQRRSILRLTDHIIDLSDLVLIFFDARHPEPGAMQDTLRHLVATTVKRPDSGKFLYILNQIDTTAREDNPEEVVAAWQRAVAQAGLTTGRFFAIYNEEAAVPIEDESLRARYETKCARDLGEIYGRLDDVEVERSYRIIKVLDVVANELESEVVPALDEAMAQWRKRVIWGDIGAGVLAAVIIGGMLAAGLGGVLGGLVEWLQAHPTGLTLFLFLVLVILVLGHQWIRAVMARSVAAGLPELMGEVDLRLREAFVKNTRFFRSTLRESPVGWGALARRRLQEVRDIAATHIQKLNDLYTDPSGRRANAPGGKPLTAAESVTVAPAAPARVVVEG